MTTESAGLEVLETFIERLRYFTNVKLSIIKNYLIVVQVIEVAAVYIAYYHGLMV